ncbi:2-phytyl-1,4-beta-naphthoquinone methyltransferase, chloroplastic [Raphanus sativus]|uniref:2-phytyl-1,4-beta-naphthoquinone methyltransferase, chloroplastic n=1 Tax=Raphanus sativus TaxID=3726 RepID=A0A6J0KIU1_RAPSA|nr:2-phytyl-1,4-beta-naphthoquinone methyltransferase, chloroplastic [Raphanus sativus]
MSALLGIVFPVTFTGHGQLPAKLHSSRRRLVVKSSNSSSERQILFNRIAPVYDNLNDLLSLGQHRIWKNMAVSWSGARTGDKVLDLCCGSGDLAFLLSEKVGPSGKVMGLDFSSEQLAVAASRQKLRGRSCYKCIEWIEGDATDLPFDDCEFDAITMGYGLRNVVDRRRAMREMYRVLKPGCRVSILDFNKSNQSVTTFMQDWMIDNIVVPVATLYDLAKEYEYLKYSISEYLTGEELETLALEAGFSSARHYEISGGFMGIWSP